MAEGWARHLKGDVIEPFSAGTDPHGMNLLAIRAMAEAGIDIAEKQSKHVNSLKDIVFDFVVTVCDSAHESCPIFPNAVKVVHVGFDDPPRLAKNAANDEEAMPHYRRIRDEIRTFVESLPDSLTKGDRR